ncbi:MAG TPA: sodium/glutamate symporter [Tepidisphaeraceae bacterium]|nr:sodium/glutamate symporter [Tepidisphaeraceae bacterium]
MTTAVLIAAGFLLFGVWLRWQFKWLSAIHAPAALIAGLIALLAAQLWSRDGSNTAALLFNDALRQWESWRSPLIPIIFAGMLLVKPDSKPAGQLLATTQQAIGAWILILGQLCVGLLATWLLLSPAWGVPIHFGQLLEVSWAGGFGSSAAWGEVHRSRGSYEGAADLAAFLTASGLLYGVLSGLVIVNIGIRRRWLTTSHPARAAQATAAESSSIRSPIRSIDPLMFQMLLLAAAFGVGLGLQSLISLAVKTLPAGSPIRGVGGDLPLFVFTLLGGWLVRKCMSAVRCDALIENETINRLTGVALELLVFVAIATLKVAVIRDNVTAACVLMAIGAAWVWFNVVWISPRILPRRCWFELALMNHGFATATTAQGMMLLRMVDPELKTDAARVYAQAAPLTAMFIGGGLLTYALPEVLIRFHPIYVIAPTAIAALVLFSIGIRLRKRAYS